MTEPERKTLYLDVTDDEHAVFEDALRYFAVSLLKSAADEFCSCCERPAGRSGLDDRAAIAVDLLDRATVR